MSIEKDLARIAAALETLVAFQTGKTAAAVDPRPKPEATTEPAAEKPAAKKRRRAAPKKVEQVEETVDEFAGETEAEAEAEDEAPPPKKSGTKLKLKDISKRFFDTLNDIKAEADLPSAKAEAAKLLKKFTGGVKINEPGALPENKYQAFLDAVEAVRADYGLDGEAEDEEGFDEFD